MGRRVVAASSLVGATAVALPAVVAVVAAVALLVAVEGPRAASGAAPRPLVVGSVGADGSRSPGGPPSPTGAGWTATRLDTGRYVVDVDPADARRDPVRLEVTGWDAVARVTVVPLAGGAAEVSFSRDGDAVDTRFSFRAAIRPPPLR
jgi:hypothetical protein